MMGRTLIRISPPTLVVREEKKIGRPQTYHILGQVYYFMMKYTAEKEKKLLNPKLTVMINRLNYPYPTLVFIKITHLKDFLF
jgi:hypothetical protein